MVCDEVTTRRVARSGLASNRHDGESPREEERQWQ